MSSARLTRDQVPLDQQWNLADIYATVDDWRAAVARIDNDIAAITVYQGRLEESAVALLACLQANEQLVVRLDRIRIYTYFLLSADGAQAANQAMAEQAAALIARVKAALSSVYRELALLPATTVARYLEQEPDIAVFRPLLDDLARQRAHLLSPETERALAALGETMTAPQTTWQLATTLDLTCAPARDAHGAEVPVSIAAYGGAHALSPDRALRRSSYLSLTAGLRGQQATLAAALATHIKQNVVLARLRGYGSATEMILARQRTPSAVYHAVLDVIHDEIAPHARRLARVRARAQGLEKLRYYDLDAPLDPAYAPPITFEEAGGWIRDAVGLFGAEYGEIIANAFRHRWIDRADNVGKRSGAFSWPVYGEHPYVFLTWRDSYRNAFTLAHELGHTGHYHLTYQNQVQSTFSQDALTLVVEAPSTANELLLGRSLLDRATDPRQRRWLLGQVAETFTTNMVRALLAAHLERRLYELAEAGRPLPLGTILEVQGEVLERFYAGTVEIDEGARLGWALMPHFYMSIFLYSYSAGLAAACTAVDAMREQGQPAIDRWLRMLTLGATRPPLELLAVGGVDIGDPATLRKAVGYFGSIVDELEQYDATR